MFSFKVEIVNISILMLSIDNCDLKRSCGFVIVHKVIGRGRRELRVLDSPRGVYRVPVVLDMIREVLAHSGQPLRAHDNSVNEDTDGV